MKTVWILNHYAQEPSGTGGTRHYGLAKHFIHSGWQANIIAASVEHYTGRQRLENNEKIRHAKFDNVDFLWVKTPQYNGNGGGRIRNMLVYTARVLQPSVTSGLTRPDVVIGSSVHPFAAWSGAMLAKRFDVPFVFEVRDLWPQTLIDMDKLQANGIASKLLQCLEGWLYRRANKIVILQPRASSYIIPLGVNPEKIIWVPNGVELEAYPEPSRPPKKPIFTLMYFGAHGQGNDLGRIIEAMAELKKMRPMKPVILRLIGAGPEKSALQKRTIELGLDNVRFEPPVPKQDIPTIAKDADAFIIVVKDLLKLNRFGMSMNKLFDYFAAARPVIIASVVANNPVQEAKAGVTARPDNPTELAKTIVGLVAMPDNIRAAMGRAGRSYVEQNHSYKALAAKFISIFNEVISEHQ